MKPHSWSPDLRVWIPGRPPTPNARHGNHFAEAEALREWRRTAMMLAKDAVNRSDWVAPDLVSLTVTFVLPDLRHRDLDNLVASSKPLTDGLVDAKALKGDSLSDIVSLTYQWRYERGVAGTLYAVAPARAP